MQFGVNFMDLLSDIHATNGYVIGDLSPSNIFVVMNRIPNRQDWRQGLSLDIRLIDCDPWQIRRPNRSIILSSGVNQPEYLAPEMVDKDFTKEERLPNQDNLIAIALLYKLLMMDQNPIDEAGVIAPTLVELAGTNPKEYAILNKKQPDPRNFPVGSKRLLPLAILGPKLRNVMANAFIHYYNPADPMLRFKRPDPDTVKEALKETISMLVVCPQNKNHVYAEGPDIEHKGCIWCQRKELDYFPA